MTTLIYAVIGYLFLLLTVRILSRRPGGQLAPLEFVLIFLIGGVVILTTVGTDRSSTNCFVAVVTIGLLHRTIATLKQKFPRVGALIDGTPLMVIRDGQWQEEVLEKIRIDQSDVLSMARTKGVRNLSEIQYAVLERNGSISIVKRKQA